jgi:hypothetical protein
MKFELRDDMYMQTLNNFNTAIVDGKFPASGSFIPVGNYNSFAFCVRVGTLDSELTLQVYQDTSATQTADVKVITGATLTVAADDDNELQTIQVESDQIDINNNFHYVTLDISGAAGSNDYLDLIFLGVIPRTKPVTQHANYTTAVFIAG